MPARILRLDKRQLLRSCPALDSLFQRDRLCDARRLLDENGFVHVVAAGKATRLPFAVLKDSRFDVVGDTGIWGRVRTVCQDVDVVMGLHCTRLQAGSALPNERDLVSSMALPLLAGFFVPQNDGAARPLAAARVTADGAGRAALAVDEGAGAVRAAGLLRNLEP